MSLIPITMTKSKYLTTSSVSKGAEQLDLPCIAGGNTKWSGHFVRKLSRFFFLNKVKCIFTR